MSDECVRVGKDDVSCRSRPAVCLSHYIYDMERRDTRIEQLEEALRFYANPKTYEVQHSTDPDVCSSTHCGCSACPIREDEGHKAYSVLMVGSKP